MGIKIEHFFVVYGFIGFLTFGVAYNLDYEESKSKFISSAEVNTTRALMSGMMWPLYWTTKGFINLRPKEYR